MKFDGWACVWVTAGALALGVVGFLGWLQGRAQADADRYPPRVEYRDPPDVAHLRAADREARARDLRQTCRIADLEAATAALKADRDEARHARAVVVETVVAPLLPAQVVEESDLIPPQAVPVTPKE